MSDAGQWGRGPRTGRGSGGENPLPGDAGTQDQRQGAFGGEGGAGPQSPPPLPDPTQAQPPVSPAGHDAAAEPSLAEAALQDEDHFSQYPATPRHRPYFTQLDGGYRAAADPAEIRALKHEVQQLRKDKQELWRTIDRLTDQLNRKRAVADKYEGLADRYNTLLYKNEQLMRQMEGKEDQVQQLLRERDAAMDREDVLQARLSRMMREVAEQNRSRTGTFTSSDRPRTHLLLEEFKQIRDQLVASFCHELLRRTGGDGPLLPEQRKARMGQLRAVLAAQILAPPPAGVDASDAAVRRAEQALAEVIGDVPGDLLPSVRQLGDRAAALLQQMGQTDPPGRLVHATPGEPFDATLHTPAMGSLAEGSTIELMLFPGYAVETVLHEKALVRTVAPGYQTGMDAY